MPADRDETAARPPRWAERHPHLATAFASPPLALPLTAAVAVAGEPAQVVAVAFAAIAATTLVFFEVFSWLFRRPLLLMLFGLGPAYRAEDGRYRWVDTWAESGEGVGQGG